MHCVASKDEIASMVRLLGLQILADYIKAPPTLVAIANGSLFFAPDLIRAIGLDLHVEIIKARSYRGSIPEAVRVGVEMLDESDVRDKDILIVDDILETGATVNAVIAQLRERGARNIELCTLLIKQGKQVFPVVPKYCGFVVDDVWVVGYGLDHDGKYRTQPYLGVPREMVHPGQQLRRARPWMGGGDLSHAS